MNEAGKFYNGTIFALVMGFEVMTAEVWILLQTAIDARTIRTTRTT